MPTRPENTDWNVSLTGSNVPQGQEIPVKIAGADSSGGAINTNGKSQEFITPSDIQTVYNEPITLFASKAVNTVSWDTSSTYVQVDKCSKLAVNTKLDSNKPFKVDLYWSEDGTNITTIQHLADKTEQWDSQVVEVRSPWVKAVPYNGDTVTRTFEIKGYKKAL
jgi:hypothetical protein